MVYRIPIRNGEFNIILEFAEIQSRSEVFDVIVQQRLIHAGLNVSTSVGNNTALRIAVVALVTHGEVEIRLRSVNGSRPYISGIIIAKTTDRVIQDGNALPQRALESNGFVTNGSWLSIVVADNPPEEGHPASNSLISFTFSLVDGACQYEEKVFDAADSNVLTGHVAACFDWKNNVMWTYSDQSNKIGKWQNRGLSSSFDFDVESKVVTSPLRLIETVDKSTFSNIALMILGHLARLAQPYATPCSINDQNDVPVVLKLPLRFSIDIATFQAIHRILNHFTKAFLSQVQSIGGQDIHGISSPLGVSITVLAQVLQVLSTHVVALGNSLTDPNDIGLVSIQDGNRSGILIDILDSLFSILDLQLNGSESDSVKSGVGRVQSIVCTTLTRGLEAFYYSSSEQAQVLIRLLRTKIDQGNMPAVKRLLLSSILSRFVSKRSIISSLVNSAANSNGDEKVEANRALQDLCIVLTDAVAFDEDNVVSSHIPQRPSEQVLLLYILQQQLLCKGTNETIEICLTLFVEKVLQCAINVLQKALALNSDLTTSDKFGDFHRQILGFLRASSFGVLLPTLSTSVILLDSSSKLNDVALEKFIDLIKVC